MNSLQFTALVFTGLILLFAEHESRHAIKLALEKFKREYRAKRLRSLITLIYLIAIGVGPIGHYALEAGMEFKGH